MCHVTSGQSIIYSPLLFLPQPYYFHLGKQFLVLFSLITVLLQDLWRSRCSLKDVEGFDHSVANDTFGACGDLPGEQQGPCLPYYVWQCGYSKVNSLPHFKHTTNIVSLKKKLIISQLLQKLSKVYSLMDFNFSEPIHSCFGETKVPF